MLRLLVKQCSLQNGNIKILQFHRFNSSELRIQRPKEINNVILIGTICHEVFKLRNGTTKFYLKTTESDHVYNVHRVAVANRNLQKVIGDNLAIGKRVYVAGNMKSTQFLNKSGDTRQNVEILANEMYSCDTNDDTKVKNSSSSECPTECNTLSIRDDLDSNDQNNVVMLAQIFSNVENGDDFSVFNLSTHYTVRKGTDAESENKDSHRVIVRDKSLLEIVRNQFKQFDRVYVEGIINYRNTLDSDKKQRSSGFIIARRLVKLKKLYRNIAVNVM